MEALAAGDARALRGKRPARRDTLQDPRGRGLFPGVSNYDARAVYDACVARLRSLVHRRQNDPEAGDRLAEELCTAARVGLWRGRSVVGFDAFCADVIGLEPEEGRRLARAGAAQQDATLQRLPDVEVAAWMRAEAALHALHEDSRVRLTGPDGDARIVIELSAARAAEALAGIGRREASLVKLIEEQNTPDENSSGARSRQPRPKKHTGTPRDKRSRGGRRS